MKQRYFRDEVSLSIIGFPGLMLAGMDENAASRLVAEALDWGINYFDVAPAYGSGQAEISLGKALRGRRERVFLASKTDRRDAAGARSQLEASLRRLSADRLDLYQFHGLTRMEEVCEILAPGGAAEALLRAREAGLIRYLGYSAHSVEAALALLERFSPDSILFPVNFVCYGNGNFGPQVIGRARALGVARIALKALALTRDRRGQGRNFPNCWYRPIEDPELANLALRFALSEDVTSALPPADESLFRMAVEQARAFVPLDPAERRLLRERARGIRPLMTGPHGHNPGCTTETRK